MLGISLVGGGSRGLVQAAFALAVRDLGIKYDMLFSSSVGSINAIKIHANEYEELIDVWLKIKESDVYLKKPLDLARCYRRKYIHDSSPLRKLIDTHINYEALMANTSDLWINTTDLSNNTAYSREVKTLVNKKDIVDFVYASASPPVYFPTVWFEGKELCDSGVVNNYSITEAINQGCDTLILLLPAKPVKDPPSNNILDVLNKVLKLSMQSYLDRESKAIIKINNIIDTIHSAIEKSECSVILKDLPKKIKLIMVYPESDPTFGFLDFDYKGIDREKLISDSYDRCKSVLKTEFSQD